MAKHMWRSFFGCAAALLAARDADGVAGIAGAGPQAGGMRRPTPHKIRLVKVAPGVELEVLDWGGKGKAMVLLTGAGDNAHVYDEFAYPVHRLFHVIGITRRGFLPSSQPRNGYDVPTRARTTSRCSMPWASARRCSSGIRRPARN